MHTGKLLFAQLMEHLPPMGAFRSHGLHVIPDAWITDPSGDIGRLRSLKGV